MAVKGRRLRSANARVGNGGRLVIPAEFRRDLGLEPGASVAITETAEGDLLVSTPAAGLRRAREILRRYVPLGDSVVDEFLRERREQAAHE